MPSSPLCEPTCRPVDDPARRPSAPAIPSLSYRHNRGWTPSNRPGSTTIASIDAAPSTPIRQRGGRHRQVRRVEHELLPGQRDAEDHHIGQADTRPAPTRHQWYGRATTASTHTAVTSSVISAAVDAWVCCAERGAGGPGRRAGRRRTSRRRRSSPDGSAEVITRRTKPGLRALVVGCQRKDERRDADREPGGDRDVDRLEREQQRSGAEAVWTTSPACPTSNASSTEYTVLVRNRLETRSMLPITRRPSPTT